MFASGYHGALGQVPMRHVGALRASSQKGDLPAAPHSCSGMSLPGPVQNEVLFRGDEVVATRPLEIDSCTIYTASMAKRSMQEATFLILTALAAGSQHGYGIITDVEQISKGRVRLRAGTLYTALERLCTDRLIEVDREEIVESRLRRYYRLTPAGAERLAEEADRLRSNAHVAMSRLEMSSRVATT